MNSVISREKDRLDRLFKMTALVSDDELKANWAQYLCILVSGMVENILKNLILEYANAHSHPNILNFIQSQIDNLTNLKEEKIKQTLRAFNVSWYDHFERGITDDQKAALDSIVANRNNIAHGVPTSITFARVHNYYLSIIKAMKLIDDIIG